MGKKSRLWVLALILFLSPGLCGEMAADEEEQSLCVLAYAIEPFFYFDTEGKTAGFELDLLRSYAEDNGLVLEIEWVEVFGELLPKVADRQGCVAGGTITITQERSKLVDFTGSHFPSRVVLIEKRGPSPATRIGDLAGKRIALLGGTTYQTILEDIPGIELVWSSNDEEAFEMVTAREADALATDSAVYFWLSERFPDLAPRFALSDREFYGFALAKGSPLKTELDAHLETLKRDGRYRNFLRAAFGGRAVDIIDSLSEEILDEEMSISELGR